MLIHRLIVVEERRVEYFDGIGWATSVAKAFGDPATTERWLDRLCAVDILFLDDLFKGRLTEAQELAMLGVYERRAGRQLPIIATMNATGAQILERMTEAGRADRGGPLLRRMREFSRIVLFGDPKAASATAEQTASPSEDMA